MKALLLVTLALMPASCADAVVAMPDPSDVILRVTTSGGCAQLGPNCVRIDVYGDGTAKVYRIAPDGIDLVDTSTIDLDPVIALHREVSSTHLLALRRGLPPGECRGCYDGIDTTMSFPFTVGNRAVMPMEFSSVLIELDLSEPVFSAAWEVYEAAQAVTEVPVIAG